MRHSAIKVETNSWTPFIGLLVLAFVVVSALTLVGVSRLDSAFSVGAFKQTLLDLGHWGVLASIGVMIAHSFLPFPAELVACANGMVYGPFWGTVITWIGAMLGACAAFAIARRFGRPLVSRIIPRRHQPTIARWSAEEGWQIFFLCRFIPIVAFNLVNYAAGLTHLSWWAFIWTTGLGILPMIVLMVLLGDNVEHVSIWVWGIIAGVGIGIWLVLITVRHRRSSASSGKDSS